ncbi:MAG TPA: ABC transporter permease [Bryobacteraceae bacterium]|nr:ABC transporter permease [Bryobacteraceae bacterium]
MDPEIAYHVDRLTQDYVAQGLDPREARRRALLEFGGPAQIEEDLRDIRRPRWLADLRQDLVYAARTLRRSRGFLASAVLTLALGTGANTAIFSLIDAVMLRPMPAVRAPAEVVQIARVMEECGSCAVSYPLFEYFHDRLSSISGSFVEMAIRHEITIDGVDEDATGSAVSGEYYQVLGLAPAAGRLLTPLDDAVPTPVAVISYDYWRRRFGLDPAAIGARLTYATTTLTIVGVEPKEFEGTSRWREHSFAAPLSMVDALNGGNGKWRSEWSLNSLAMMARLKSGVTLERANAEVTALFEPWIHDRAATIPVGFQRQQILNQHAVALSGAAGMNGLRLQFIKPLAILMGIVALVLLLACANISGLLLARAAARQREISVRRALGASNGRLVRQFLAESLLLALCGAAVGFGAAQWFSRMLINMMANGDSLSLKATADWRVFAFTGAVSLVVCVLGGLAPGLGAARARINPALKEVRAGGYRHLGRLLVVAQLAISMTLLVGASLFIRSLVKLYSVDTGMRTGGVFLANVTSKHHFPPARSREIESAIIDDLRRMPGVMASSAANMVPLGGGEWNREVQVEDRAFRPGEDNTTLLNAVSPGYFRVTGTPILLGRDFDARDESSQNHVVIVNESFVHQLLAGQQPLGKHVTSNNVRYEIIGVAADTKYQNLRKGVSREMYLEWVQQQSAEPGRWQPMGYTYMARVSAGDPMRLAPLMERAMPEIDPAMRIFRPQTFEDQVNESTLNERIMATLGGFFGVLALIVACLGIFGILAFQVSRRINEIGIRMALGAARRDIVALVLREAALILVPGCLAGSLAAVVLSRFATSFLFGVTPTDPAAFGIAALALALSTLAAGYLPARRAARVDPMAALRCD